jgi:hypothetical protein
MYDGGNVMTSSEATAEVFYTAFRALPSREKNSIIRKLLEDRLFREDVGDILVAIQREKERSDSYDRVRKTLKESGRL